MAKRRKTRTPMLQHTTNRGIGWHASYRDSKTGIPKKKRFGNISEEDAKLAYHTWLVEHFGGDSSPINMPRTKVAQIPESQPTQPNENVLVPGSLVDIATSLIEFDEKRSRKSDESRRTGTIDPEVCSDRKRNLHTFLRYMNKAHGDGAVARMRLADLGMQDVEGFNEWLVKSDYSGSRVAKHMQVVKALIDRGGRPEHGHQVLLWNWDSRDVFHGRQSVEKKLPTTLELKALLNICDCENRTIVWLGIGVGLGQRDVSSVRVGQIDKKTYDLRRGKTGVERYGQTPPLVWAYIEAFQKEQPRRGGKLLFQSNKGFPLVHGSTDAIAQRWRRLRTRMGPLGKSLPGFYTLRHLGATEFGSRPGCSLSEMRRWLGHSASSRLADIYMRPVSPENKAVVEWVRKRLQSSKLDPMPQAHSKSSRSR